MEKSTFKVSPKASVSLASLVGRAERRLRPALAARAAGIASLSTEAPPEEARTAVLLEAICWPPRPRRSRISAAASSPHTSRRATRRA